MQALKLVFVYARRYRKLLSITVVSMILMVGVQFLAPCIVRTLVAAVQNGTWEEGSLSLVTRPASLLLLLYVLRGVLSFLRSYEAHVAGRRAEPALARSLRS